MLHQPHYCTNVAPPDFSSFPIIKRSLKGNHFEMLGNTKEAVTRLKHIAPPFLKMLLVMNLIILVLYRTGYGGQFLGVGGTWNLNEEKNPDAEIVASGVFVGFFLYTSAVLISYCFGTTQQKKTLVEIIMNFIGTFMFVAVGGTALHYWHGYQSEHKYQMVDTERSIGLALGSLCVLTGATYLLDTVLSFIHFAKSVE
ncbi:protein snakeskin [Hetaerina americana]|uniref:protein snakeskin n=1 Tax=Hetaerina americana TaxID=62018 RepID=UPI003A7F1897